MNYQELLAAKKKVRIETIETIIDQMGLPEVLEIMSKICYEKAKHLTENWQDNKAAQRWISNGKKLETISPKLYS